MSAAEPPPRTASAARAIVGVDGEGHADPAIRAAFKIARRLGLEVELVHAAEVPHLFWQHLEEADVGAARKATLERLAASLDGEGLAESGLDQRLVVVPGPPARALLERARELDARLIVLGRHVGHGILDFGDTVRAVLARADCPVWVQAGEPAEPRRILVPIDLSEESLQALALARDWAQAFGASISVLHCFVRPELGFVLGYPIPFPTSVVDSARDTAEEEFKGALEGFDWRGVAHEESFVEADPGTEILERQAEADLIVMGTHGRTGLSGAILGSVAVSVLREARVPVLAIRSATRAWLT